MLTEIERIIEYRRHVRELDAIDVQPIASPLVRLTVADVSGAIPPAELADSVVWSDARRDWVYRRTGSADVNAYLAWRGTWETSHTLGRIGSLRQLVSSMRDRGVELDEAAAAALHRLLRGDPTADGQPVSVDELDAITEVVADFAARVRSSGSLGVALVESSPTSERTGLLRSWPSAPLDGELSTRGTVTVRFSGSKIGVWFADDRDPIADVRSFELGIDGAVVVDAEGHAHVLDADASDALADVAPETTAWRVRRVPEVLVWADLLAALEGVADAVALSGAHPRIRLGDERHVALSSGD